MDSLFKLVLKAVAPVIIEGDNGYSLEHPFLILTTGGDYEDENGNFWRVAGIKLPFKRAIWRAPWRLGFNPYS